MKKILIIIAGFCLLASNAFAAGKMGVSAAFTMFDSSGTETTKSSGEKNSTTVEEDVVVPSFFVEFESGPVSIGLDYVPVAELGSGTGSDDDAETSGANKASAELAKHITGYVLLPIGSAGGYVKTGVAYASIDTTETLATGTKYGDENVLGFMVGVGVEGERGDGVFVRAEASYTDYEDVTFNGSLNGNAAGDSAVRNKIDANVDSIALRLSVGKSF